MSKKQFKDVFTAPEEGVVPASVQNVDKTASGAVTVESDVVIVNGSASKGALYGNGEAFTAVGYAGSGSVKSVAGLQIGEGTEASAVTVGNNLSAKVVAGAKYEFSKEEAKNPLSGFESTVEIAKTDVTVLDAKVTDAFAGAVMTDTATSKKFTDKYSVVVDDADIKVVGGTVTNVYGGGTGALSYVKDANIYISGGKVTNVYAGGLDGAVVGDANIFVDLNSGAAAAAMSIGTIYAGGKNANLFGDVVVTVTTNGAVGSNGKINKIVGTPAGKGVVYGTRELYLDAYQGDFTASVVAMDKVVIASDSAVTFTKAQDKSMKNAEYVLEVSEADNSNQAAILTLKSAYNINKLTVSVADNLITEGGSFTRTLVAGVKGKFNSTTFDADKVNVAKDNGNLIADYQYDLSFETITDAKGKEVETGKLIFTYTGADLKVSVDGYTNRYGVANVLSSADDVVTFVKKDDLMGGSMAPNAGTITDRVIDFTFKTMGGDDEVVIEDDVWFTGKLALGAGNDTVTINGTLSYLELTGENTVIVNGVLDARGIKTDADSKNTFVLNGNFDGQVVNTTTDLGNTTKLTFYYEDGTWTEDGVDKKKKILYAERSAVDGNGHVVVTKIPFNGALTGAANDTVEVDRWIEALTQNITFVNGGAVPGAQDLTLTKGDNTVVVKNAAGVGAITLAGKAATVVLSDVRGTYGEIDLRSAETSTLVIDDANARLGGFFGSNRGESNIIVAKDFNAATVDTLDLGNENVKLTLKDTVDLTVGGSWNSVIDWEDINWGFNSSLTVGGVQAGKYMKSLVGNMEVNNGSLTILDTMSDADLYFAGTNAAELNVNNAVNSFITINNTNAKATFGAFNADLLVDDARELIFNGDITASNVYFDADVFANGNGTVGKVVFNGVKVDAESAFVFDNNDTALTVELDFLGTVDFAGTLNVGKATANMHFENAEVTFANKLVASEYIVHTGTTAATINMDVRESTVTFAGDDIVVNNLTIKEGAIEGANSVLVEGVLTLSGKFDGFGSEITMGENASAKLDGDIKLAEGFNMASKAAVEVVGTLAGTKAEDANTNTITADVKLGKKDAEAKLADLDVVGSVNVVAETKAAEIAGVNVSKDVNADAIAKVVITDVTVGNDLKAGKEAALTNVKVAGDATIDAGKDKDNKTTLTNVEVAGEIKAGGKDWIAMTDVKAGDINVGANAVMSNVTVADDLTAGADAELTKVTVGGVADIPEVALTDKEDAKTQTLTVGNNAKLTEVDVFGNLTAGTNAVMSDVTVADDLTVGANAVLNDVTVGTPVAAVAADEEVDTLTAGATVNMTNVKVYGDMVLNSGLDKKENVLTNVEVAGKVTGDANYVTMSDVTVGDTLALGTNADLTNVSAKEITLNANAELEAVKADKVNLNTAVITSVEAKELNFTAAATINGTAAADKTAFDTNTVTMIDGSEADFGVADSAAIKADGLRKDGKLVDAEGNLIDVSKEDHKVTVTVAADRFDKGASFTQGDKVDAAVVIKGDDVLKVTGGNLNLAVDSFKGNVRVYDYNGLTPYGINVTSDIKLDGTFEADVNVADGKKVTLAAGTEILRNNDELTNKDAYGKLIFAGAATLTGEGEGETIASVEKGITANGNLTVYGNIKADVDAKANEVTMGKNAVPGDYVDFEDKSKAAINAMIVGDVKAAKLNAYAESVVDGNVTAAVEVKSEASLTVTGAIEGSITVDETKDKEGSLTVDTIIVGADTQLQGNIAVNKLVAGTHKDGEEYVKNDAASLTFKDAKTVFGEGATITMDAKKTNTVTLNKDQALNAALSFGYDKDNNTVNTLVVNGKGAADNLTFADNLKIQVNTVSFEELDENGAKVNKPYTSFGSNITMAGDAEQNLTFEATNGDKVIDMAGKAIDFGGNAVDEKGKVIADTLTVQAGDTLKAGSITADTLVVTGDVDAAVTAKSLDINADKYTGKIVAGALNFKNASNKLTVNSTEGIEIDTLTLEGEKLSVEKTVPQVKDGEVQMDGDKVKTEEVASTINKSFTLYASDSADNELVSTAGTNDNKDIILTVNGDINVSGILNDKGEEKNVANVKITAQVNGSVNYNDMVLTGGSKVTGNFAGDDLTIGAGSVITGNITGKDEAAEAYVKAGKFELVGGQAAQGGVNVKGIAGNVITVGDNAKVNGTANLGAGADVVSVAGGTAATIGKIDFGKSEFCAAGTVANFDPEANMDLFFDRINAAGLGDANIQVGEVDFAQNLAFVGDSALNIKRDALATEIVEKVNAAFIKSLSEDIETLVKGEKTSTYTITADNGLEYKVTFQYIGKDATDIKSVDAGDFKVTLEAAYNNTVVGSKDDSHIVSVKTATFIDGSLVMGDKADKLVLNDSLEMNALTMGGLDLGATMDSKGKWTATGGKGSVDLANSNVVDFGKGADVLVIDGDKTLTAAKVLFETLTIKDGKAGDKKILATAEGTTEGATLTIDAAGVAITGIKGATVEANKSFNVTAKVEDAVINLNRTFTYTAKDGDKPAKVEVTAEVEETGGFTVGKGKVTVNSVAKWDDSAVTAEDKKTIDLAGVSNNSVGAIVGSTEKIDEVDTNVSSLELNAKSYTGVATNVAASTGLNVTSVSTFKDLTLSGNVTFTDGVNDAISDVDDIVLTADASVTATTDVNFVKMELATGADLTVAVGDVKGTANGDTLQLDENSTISGNVDFVSVAVNQVDKLILGGMNAADASMISGTINFGGAVAANPLKKDEVTGKSVIELKKDVKFANTVVFGTNSLAGNGFITGDKQLVGNVDFYGKLTLEGNSAVNGTITGQGVNDTLVITKAGVNTANTTYANIEKLSLDLASFAGVTGAVIDFTAQEFEGALDLSVFDKESLAGLKAGDTVTLIGTSTDNLSNKAEVFAWSCTFGENDSLRASIAFDTDKYVLSVVNA